MTVTIDPESVKVVGAGPKQYRMSCKATENGIDYAVKINITNTTTADQILALVQTEIALQKIPYTSDAVKQAIVSQLKAKTATVPATSATTVTTTPDPVTK